MTVIIRDMQMPKNCDVCPLVRVYPYANNVWCNSKNKIVGDKRDDGNISRPKWCPLFEVKDWRDV